MLVEIEYFGGLLSITQVQRTEVFFFTADKQIPFKLI